MHRPAGLPVLQQFSMNALDILTVSAMLVTASAIGFRASKDRVARASPPPRRGFVRLAELVKGRVGLFGFGGLCVAERG